MARSAVRRASRRTASKSSIFAAPRARSPCLCSASWWPSAVRARSRLKTNDVLLTLMFVDCAVDWQSETILFADEVTTTLSPPSAVTLRPVTEADRATVFKHTVEPVGDWGLGCNGELAATGGLFFHYNPPYGDIYLEVAPRYRRRGFASYLVQELKRICRDRQCIPGARCQQDNEGSRRALERAGMFPCARILRGTIEAGSVASNVDRSTDPV